MSEEDPLLAEAEGAAEKRKAADGAFAEKLAKRSPPDAAERAAIKTARTRTKARAAPVVTRIDGHGMYSAHSEEEGHRFRLADAFGTRSKHFVYSMLKGLGKATEDYSEKHGFLPGSADEIAFNAALAVIDGVRPKDEIEAMLAAHMAVTNIALLELFARTRGALAGEVYRGNGIQRLDVLGNLTIKFMRAYAIQVEALARKRRKGEQNVTVKHVHVHAGGQAVVGNVSHRGGRGVRKNEQQAYDHKGRPIKESPPMRSADQERETLPISGDEKGSLPVARRRKR